MTMWNKEKDIIFLAVGHGKSLDGSWDSGCVYGDYTEADLMLKITKVAVKWLRKSGVKVLTDADDGNNRNMKSCVAWANKKGVKYYMSVHCDYKGAPKGVMPLYKSASGKRFADGVGKYVAKAMKMAYRGATKRDDLFELNATNATACILETGSIKADLIKLRNYKLYGKVLAKAICKYIGVEFYVSNATKLRRKAAAVFDVMTKLKFKYKAGGNATSWAVAKKKKTSNCATYVSYTLQVMGLLKPGQVFWCNDGKVKTKGFGTMKQLKKIATITHPNKSPKKAGIKKGDICGYSNPPHTQIFAGWKNGNALWYSFGGSDVGKKLPRKRGKYNTKKIDTIIRLK